MSDYIRINKTTEFINKSKEVHGKNNNLIKVFNTGIECAKYFKVNRKTINNKIKGGISKNEELNKYLFLHNEYENFIK